MKLGVFADRKTELDTEYGERGERKKQRAAKHESFDRHALIGLYGINQGAKVSSSGRAYAH